MTAMPEPVGHSPRPQSAAPLPVAREGGARHLARGWEGETYYGRNVVKPSPFNWMVSTYIFLAGLSGSAEIIATVADLAGAGEERRMVSRGRRLALLAVAAGPPLLIADLHTPARFANMLRIFRRTSPMSIGSWVLTGFGGFAVATAGADALGRHGLARVVQIPAALLGAGMSVYTAALLAATSTPLWAAAPRLLAVRFGSSAMASAAALMALAERADGDPGTAARLDGIAAAGTAVDLAASLAAGRVYREKGVDAPLRETPWGAAHRLGAEGAGAVVPLACYAAGRLGGRRSAGLAIAAAVGILAGGAIMRFAVLYAGNASARRAPDYFRFTEADGFAGSGKGR